jgi:hypothetical protein
MPRKFRLIGGGHGGAHGVVHNGGGLGSEIGSILLTVLLVLGAAIAAIYIAQKYGLLTPPKPTVVVVNGGGGGVAAPPVVLNSDPRFAPLSPERSYGVPPDLRGYPSLPLAAGLGALPVNTQSRGIPDTYQQVGVITTQGGTDNSGTPTRTILPLFGRAVDAARNKWNYYTRTDGMNPVQVPLQFKRRNCDSDTGCDEITDGDNIGVPVMGQSFTANIYRYSTPRYLPV